ncbi:hypothetical protein HDV06_006920 [Boothiomyces sp. JEL0866]|nr:hypothetical protein HDV06_006920 [Boothiomyces sp. JEL0866]
MDYTKFFSENSKLRKHSAIRAMQKYLSVPGMISLGGGLPNTQTFPFESISVKLKTGETIELKDKVLDKALQYGSTPGDSQLVDWLRQLQEQVHNPPYQSYDICVGNGSQDLITKAMEALINPGDTILIESPTYVGILAFLRPLGAKFLEIPVDNQGIQPDALEQALLNWPDVATRPKVLYTVPTAGNPTGLSTIYERKKKVYEIAQRYNIIILEDDPYYYLQFKTPLTPSYFSLDCDGRVLRFDSVSKILSGGMRVGWVSGPPALVERIVLHGMATNLHPSGVSQLLVHTVLNKWGVNGFLEHTRAVAQFYEKRRDALLSSLNTHLKGKAEWTVPEAGMFVWIKLPIDDSFDLINNKAREAKILLVPGVEFYPNKRDTGYVRASYSYATEEEMDEACRRLADLL